MPRVAVRLDLRSNHEAAILIVEKGIGSAPIPFFILRYFSQPISQHRHDG